MGWGAAACASTDGVHGKKGVRSGLGSGAGAEVDGGSKSARGKDIPQSTFCAADKTLEGFSGSVASLPGYPAVQPGYRACP